MDKFNFTGWQYLLIDVANQWGLDKKEFEDRIQWAEENLHQLEDLGNQRIQEGKEWKEAPLYVAACIAIRKAQKGLPTGHMVGMDAAASGLQLMAVLTGCVSAATATGLVDPNKRKDAYQEVTNDMSNTLGSKVEIARKQAKDATMTSFYGSKATPKRIFGEDTDELDAFYQAMQNVAPGPWELLQDLLAAWQPYALNHSWKMPDGYDVVVPVMVDKEVRIEVDELDHATFSYQYSENQGEKSGISLPANVVHSVDAYVLRNMHRRCNYDPQVIGYVEQCITAELINRQLSGQPSQEDIDEFMTKEVDYYTKQYQRSGIADAVIFSHLDQANVTCLEQQHLEKLAEIINGMLQYKPFELVSIHDDFKAHPNNCNWVRWQYKQILADIADSDLISDLLTQIHQSPGYFTKLSNDLGDKIRNSVYALS